MRKYHYLLALPVGLTILACESQPEKQLVASFVDAVQKKDETALGRVSLVPFEEKVEAWEIVEVSTPTSTPFQLKAMREERVEIKKKLEAMIEENDAYVREHEEIYLKYKPQKDKDPEKKFTGAMAEFDEEWTRRLDEQKALDEKFTQTGEAVDALIKAAALSTNVPGLGSSFDGDVNEMKAKVKLDQKDYTFTMKQYALVNQTNNMEPMARWIITDISE